MATTKEKSSDTKKIQDTENKQQPNTNEKDKPIISQFWTKNPYILFNPDKFLDVYPKETMTLPEKLNALTRLNIYLTFAFYLLFRNLTVLITGIAILVVLVFVYYVLDKKNTGLKEKFSNVELYQKYKHNYTNPSDSNPLMNVALTEIQDNPHRLQAAPAFNSAVNEQINEKTKNLVQNNFKDSYVKDKLFDDLGDKLQFEQSMRQFYTTSSTTVPNNQKDFAEFCYGNMASCKDGDVQECVKNNFRHTLI